MNKALQFFRWFPADAMTDERYATLTDQELGFFHRCLNHAWLNDGLPCDPDQLARVMGVTREYLDAMWIHVGLCFSKSRNVHPRWINSRQEKERAHAMSKSLKASTSVRTRYERTTTTTSNVAIRASASVVASVSSSPGGAGGAPGGAGGAPEKPAFAAVQTEWPLTTAAIRKRDPAVDDFFVRRLADTTAQRLISAGDMGTFDDEDLANAIDESYAKFQGGKHGKHGAGLLLQRVPQIILGWEATNGGTKEA
jgi:uncharacterized protein YdaU (DUF1376 family)